MDIKRDVNSLLTISEASRKFGISVHTIRKWIKSGKITAFKEGNRYKISAHELQQYINPRIDQYTDTMVNTEAAVEIALLKEQNRLYQERIRELEADFVLIDCAPGMGREAVSGLRS